MKSIHILLLILLSLSFASNQKNSNLVQQNRTVYVCGKSGIYHNSKSHGALTRCDSKITEMSESSALSSGKRICKCK